MKLAVASGDTRRGLSQRITGPHRVEKNHGARSRLPASKTQVVPAAGRSSSVSLGNYGFCPRLILLEIRGETMTPDDSKRAYRRDMLVAAAMVAAGLAISGASLAEIKAGDAQHMAQATQPLQGAPAPADQAPAESKPGGARPTTPAPQPAHPDPQAQKEGAAPALPPAPAEKTGPPIKEK